MPTEKFCTSVIGKASSFMSGILLDNFVMNFILNEISKRMLCSNVVLAIKFI